MKRVLFLMILGVIALSMLTACGGPKKPPVEAAPVETTPTEPTTPTPPPPPPPAPAPVLQESQFQTVYFDFDKFNLRNDARAALDRNYALLQEFPDAIIKIEGHCDERGTVEYNLSLGEKRAKATRDYLTGLGIAANRISIISYGKERPVDRASTEAAWAKNRRCEFRVISQ
jgi:peptidoglycan-associated lipoprotein